MFQELDTDGDAFMNFPELSDTQLMDQLGQISTPEKSVTVEEISELLEQEYQRMLEEVHRETLFGEEVDDQFVGDSAPKEFEDDEEEPECWDPSLLDRTDYFPYPSKTAMLLDIMDNLPRCRFSTAQMSLILHFAKQLGARDVPSLKSFRKMQQGLQSSCGDKPTKVVSNLGNVFYMNDICHAIAHDMANPLVAPHMHFYPEETDGPISETYQAERWMEYTPSQLTPMFSKGLKRFWIEEVAQLNDGTFVIPHTLVVRNGVLSTDVSVVEHTAEDRWRLLENEMTVNADDLELDYNDVLAYSGGKLVWMDNSKVPSMPNPLRELVAEDEDLFVVMVSPWADDVSGNRSKQYNKHMNMYTGNGCLPGRLLQQEYHVHFLSSSPHASSPEQFTAFRDHIKSTEKEPVRCYNAATQRMSRFIIQTPGLPADNPQQSEEASHIGCNGNFPCRKCGWGGTKIEKESEKIYHECHFPGIARDAAKIRNHLNEQLRLSTHGDSKAVEDQQRTTGTKDKITQHWIDILLEKFGAMRIADSQRSVDDIASELKKWLDSQPGDKMNPLLDIAGLDPSQDTPVELLHTILLGILKYIWHYLNTKQWSDSDRHLLAIRLQSTDLTGLTIPPLRAGYMIQVLMQILTLHVHDITTPEQFTLIKAAGDLGARLWVPEIDDMENYLAELKTAIANVLDAFDQVDPLRILVKIKLHLLAHIPDDVRRFGPLIRYATEIYEAFNGVFRLCSIFSNRQAPSRDISLKFASMGHVKHFLSGSFWWEPASKRWIQAGAGVQQILMNDPIFQRHLGWVSPTKTNPGFIKAMPIHRAPPLEWHQTKASAHYTLNHPPSPETRWRRGQMLTANSGDKIVLGSWVFALDPKGETVIGRVSELLVGEKSLVTLEQFICSKNLHPEFGWPILRRPNGAEITGGRGQSFVVLDAKSIQFVCSVQHDCRKGSCKPSIIRKEVQEREETHRTTMLIKHSDDDHFIILMAGLHNFINLKPLHKDRVAFHKEMALHAQGLGTQKRTKTAEKRRATAAAKKRAAEEAAAAAAEAAAAAAEAEEAVHRAERGEELPDDDDNDEEIQDGNNSDGDGGDQEEEEGEEDVGEDNNEYRSRLRKRKRR
ncbi:hypothetical protein B0H13DRAFT_2240601 [Mycena leptocephala]|nr:hypothetical protein B0H13DRAFT_2240601 [Mycena leptocephala]